MKDEILKIIQLNFELLDRCYIKIAPIESDEVRNKFIEKFKIIEITLLEMSVVDEFKNPIQVLMIQKEISNHLNEFINGSF